MNGTEKQFEPINRSKNSSPIPNNREKFVKIYYATHYFKLIIYYFKFIRSMVDSRRTARNYDIDNIVIPYSVAAATRIELLSYKEIPTPK